MDGIVLINKEKDYTSHDVVNIVKKLTKSKVGHTGTLDPNATGVLPLLLGNATKISKYLINHDKIYNVTLKLGITTTTADEEGEIIQEKEVSANVLENNNVKKILKKFIGKQKQIPPIYSAIKVNGRKLYDYARKGQTVELQPRDIEIYNIKLLSINKNLNQIQFLVECSKGTYIRSLCENIAEKLGTVGYMKDLDRIKVGKFTIENSIKIENLKKELEENNLSHIIPIEQIFKYNNEIKLEQKLLDKYINGVKIPLDNLNVIQNKDDIENKEVYRIYNNSTFIGLGIVSNGYLKRDLVL